MQTTRLSVPELQMFMLTHGIRGEIVRLDAPTPTVETAAKAVNAQLEQIIKSILFMVDNQPILAIACGKSTISRRAIADLFRVGKKRVKLAPAQVVLDISGYEIGAMPPFGHRQPLTTLIDYRVLDMTEAYAGGGGENVLVRLNPSDIRRVSDATVLNLRE